MHSLCTVVVHGVATPQGYLGISCMFAPYNTSDSCSKGSHIPIFSQMYYMPCLAPCNVQRNSGNQFHASAIRPWSNPCSQPREAPPAAVPQIVLWFSLPSPPSHPSQPVWYWHCPAAWHIQRLVIRCYHRYRVVHRDVYDFKHWKADTPSQCKKSQIPLWQLRHPALLLRR